MPVSTVGVYWSARAETAEACAARLGKCLRSIRQEFPELTSWYKLGQVSRQPISYDQDNDLLMLILKGKNKKDIGGQVIDELGFRVNLWNGRVNSEAMSLRVACSIYSENPGLSNTMNLSLPKDIGALSLTEDGLSKLMLILVEAWDPDWGSVFDVKGEAINSCKGNGPFLDKILWLKSGLMPPDVAQKSHSENTIHGGILYTN